MKKILIIVLLLVLPSTGCHRKLEITDIVYDKTDLFPGYALSEEESERFVQIYTRLYEDYLHKMPEEGNYGGRIGGYSEEFYFKQNGKEEKISLLMPAGGCVLYHGSALYVSSYHEIYDFLRELFISYPDNGQMDVLVRNFQMIEECILEEYMSISDKNGIRQGVVVVDHALGVVVANGWNTVSSAYQAAGKKETTDNTTLDELFLERTKGVYSMNTVIYDDDMAIKLIGESNNQRIYAVSQVEY